MAYIGGWFLVSLGFEQTVCPRLSSGIHIFICHLNLQRKFSSIPHIHGYRKCSSINSWNLPFSLLLEAADDCVTMCSGGAFTPIHLQGCRGSHIYTLGAPSINFKLNHRDSFFFFESRNKKNLVEIVSSRYDTYHSFYMPLLQSSKKENYVRYLSRRQVYVGRQYDIWTIHPHISKTRC